VKELKGECWLWAKGIMGTGYGQLFVRGSKPYKMVRAHIAVYEALVGPVPEGLELDHLCRVRRCVNPDHLEPVTHRENVLRGTAIAKAVAHQRAKTHCPRGHPYNKENTYYRPGNGDRGCKICRRAAVRKHKLMLKEIS